MGETTEVAQVLCALLGPGREQELELGEEFSGKELLDQDKGETLDADESVGASGG